MANKYLIFGTGTGCEDFLRNAEEDDFDHILGFIDNNKDKQGTLFKGKKVYSLDEAKDLDYHKIIIASLFFQEIKEKLVTQNIPEEKITCSIRDFTCSNFKQLMFLDNEKHKLKNKNFSIISPYCWGLFLYRFLDIPYQTPFAGSFIPFNIYEKFVENPKHYLNQKIKTEKLNVPGIGEFCRGYLDDIYIDFYHEKDPTLLEKKWYKRVERIDFDNLFVHWGNTNHVAVPENASQKIQKFENNLTITKDGSYLNSKGKKIITTKEPVDLIKWFNKEL